MKKCIVFDVDRTMIDSYLPELLSLQEAIRNVTDKKVSSEEMKKLSSLPTTDFFKYINLSDEEIRLVNEEWEQTYYKYKIECFPKIKEIISDLYNEGYIIGIITSRTMKEFHELDEILGTVLDYIKIVVTSDLINEPKPNRESMDYLCEKLNLNPNDVIYIGDGKIDKIFSENSGVDFIPACWENTELENEKDACLSPEKLIEKIKKY